MKGGGHIVYNFSVLFGLAEHRPQMLTPHLSRLPATLIFFKGNITAHSFECSSSLNDFYPLLQVVHELILFS